MSLLIRSPNPLTIDPGRWKEAISTFMPELEICLWPDVGDPAQVEYLLAQSAEPELFRRLTRLKFMQQFGAGADHILSAAAIPPDLPVSRMVDPEMANSMSLFVLAAVLRYHRNLDLYHQQQTARVWKRLPVTAARDRTVGVMGLGALGSALCAKLVALCFRVVGWSRTEKALPEVDAYHGATGLEGFLKRSEILVCLLPLTPETHGILNRDTFARMPHRSYLINAGRGEHHVLADILAALDSGQLAGATLDVHAHDPNPPPADSPIWDHRLIDITPHTATVINPVSAARYVVANIRRVRDGQKPWNVVDRTSGY